ncbi:MAG: tRNA (adenosine(37)-N6)-dimethylallyltransferase MiaA [Oscillospiraceae bacterium]|nr:tRNA (adenosine(37)-N6)-dimethylallyltransferase MiaA [Oscillospiraceae bacterium]
MAQKIVVITGPTATGKTKLSVALARAFNGEIVSADSMQLYRRMDIGTAKVTPEEAEGVPHHMVDIAEPWESYSAARYVAEASEAVDGILSRGRLPFVVGGTNLYIDSLISGRAFADNGEDMSLRRELEAMCGELGGEKMLALLAEFDPDRAAKLHPADRRRIIRAIEVYRLTGKTITQHDLETKALPPRYDAAVIALDFADRADLYARIDRRVEVMAEQGLFEEVKALLDEGLSMDSTAMQAIGYKEPAAYFRGELTRAEALELIKRESRRYAKRQLTWLRRNDAVYWIRHAASPDFNEARRLAEEYLRSFGL